MTREEATLIEKEKIEAAIADIEKLKIIANENDEFLVMASSIIHNAALNLAINIIKGYCENKIIANGTLLPESEDCISRKEAIESIKELFEMGDCYSDKYSIIGTINQMPSIQPTTKENLVVEDCISRAELIDKTINRNSIWLKTTDSRGMNLQEIIDELPSVQPKPKTDIWSIKEVADALEKHGLMISEISETEIKSMTKEQNYMRGYEDGRSDVLDKIRAEIEQEYNRLSATRADETLEVGECLGLKMALKIVGKYKAEKE